MDINQILNNYLEVSSELGFSSTTILIEEFLEKTSNQRYELPLIGQFSSGKSATINHLLGRKLLPTKCEETTAFPTFISYSEKEYAILELNDGSIENISFEEIKQLDNKKVIETGKQIKALNIGVKCNLLKSGLTFVDTPGVNTIITKHIEITERILKSAQCIVYVIAKDLTDEDFLMIQTIESHNIPVIFVRTHIDDIKKSEENWKTTVIENERSITDKLGHPVHFFAISNDILRTEFSNNFEILVRYLTKEISDNVKNVFENAILERLRPIKKELETTLSTHKQTLEQSANKSIEELERQKNKIEALIENWNDTLLTQQNRIRNKADEVKDFVKHSIRKNTDSKIEDFNVIANNSEGDVEELTSLINDRISKVSSSINTSVETIIQDEANHICRRLGKEMMSIGSDLETIGIECDCNFDMSVARDYTEKLKSIDNDYLAKVAQFNEIKEKFSQKEDLSEQAKSEIQIAISQAEEEIKAYETNVNEITNSYEPQYVSKQSHLGTIGKKIGNVLDIAMLFIPSSGWTKAGKWISKVGKSGTIVREVGKNLGRGAKLISKTDTAKDAVTILGGIKNANDKINGNIRKTSIFDYLSLSYWFEKAGEHFDPSTCELDQQYEMKFQTIKNEAETELQNALNKKKEMITHLARLNGEEWKFKQEKIETENMGKALYRETENIKARLETEKDKAVRESLISQAKEQFERRINEYTEILSHKTIEIIDTVFSAIINSADLKITDQLNSLSEQLSDIIKDKKEFVDNKDQKIAYFNNLYSKLKI